MKRDNRQCSKRPEMALQYHRANVLDVPLIFQLLQEGAEAGAFSNDFVERKGSARLLGMVLRGVVSQVFQSSGAISRYEWQIITTGDGVEVGFLKVRHGKGVCKDSNLELLAISSEHQNKGIGTTVVEYFQSKMPAGGKLYVHCTKYARAMQHILKRHHLKRNVKFGVPGLEEYQSD